MMKSNNSPRTFTGTAEFKELCPGGCGGCADGSEDCDPKSLINECQLHRGMDLCPNGKCKDLKVGFMCKCMRGFKHQAGSNRVCIGMYVVLRC